MAGYLIYHPRRHCSVFDGTVVYHDSTNGNQDPYIWNSQFLHTYCHITQLKVEINHVNFWISGDTFPNFTSLWCDLVFVVQNKQYWQQANTIQANNRIVDSPEAYNDHYRWASQHQFHRRRRYTLKANADQSFQPQTADGRLIDVVPILANLGLTIRILRNRLQARIGSKPFFIDDQITGPLFNHLIQNAPVRLSGHQLQTIRQQNECLASL